MTTEALTLAQIINVNDVAYRWQWQLGIIYKTEEKIQQAIADYDGASINLQSLRNDLVAINRTR